MVNNRTKAIGLYDKLIATQPRIERKGKKSAYTSLNGHMFSFILEKGDLALRLSKTGREAFVKKYKTRPVKVYGTVMKEYVTVPYALLAKTKEATRHFAASVDYIASLKPKPTTKKPAAKKESSGKPATGKPVAKKAAAAKKPTTRTPVAKKPAAAKKPIAKKPIAKKKATKQPVARKKALRKVAKPAARRPAAKKKR